jgi:hypothetical protein
MHFILSFAILLIILSVYMVLYPKVWASGIVRFSQWPYFHIFEILSRLFVGLGFIYFAKYSIYPKLIFGLGYLLVAVSIGLALTPSTKHRQFAVWTADKFLHVFRPSGIVSICFGIFLIYSVLI